MPNLKGLWEEFRLSIHSSEENAWPCNNLPSFCLGHILYIQGTYERDAFGGTRGPVVPSAEAVDDCLPVFAQVTGNELLKVTSQVYLDTHAIESYLHLISKNLI